MAPHNDKLWYSKIMVSGSQYLPLFVVGLVALFWINWYRSNTKPFWVWPLSVLLLFYSLTHFHPQWFAWISPFLILALITNKKTVFPIAVLLLSYIAITLSFEPSLNFGLFGINFNATSFINRYYPSDQLVSLIRGVFAGTALTLGLIL
jgi:hypothetical protein